MNVSQSLATQSKLKIKQDKQDQLQEMTFQIPQGTLLFKPNQFLDTSIDATLNNNSFSIDPQQEIFRLKQIIKI